jgi:pilus assembly protein CpaF
VRSNIAEALNLIVHIERRQGRRVVSEVLRIVRYDPDEDRFALEALHRAEPA